MAEPRLRTVNKATAPFETNKFPSSLVDTLARNVVYMMATKQSMSLEGNEWEQIFAECVGADWKPSNVGLDDVVLGNCCWGAKTVFGQADMEKQDKVRLICGRNAVTYSFGVDNYSEVDPNELGKMVLQIWNERVSAVRQVFKFVRTVVLVKSKDYKNYLVFEFDTIRYDPELYYFEFKQKIKKAEKIKLGLAKLIKLEYNTNRSAREADDDARLAQLEEHLTLNQGVQGSNP